MGFQSLDDLVSKITTDGKFLRFDWHKNTGSVAAYTAGRWYDFSGLNGAPAANAFSGTALTWQNTDESSGFGIFHGNVSPDTKHVLNVSAVTSAATGVPSQLMLVDLQGYWPGISNTVSTAQTLSGTPSLRYANGQGCRLFWVQRVASGATAQNISLSYTDQDGNTGNSLPNTVAMTASAIIGQITHSGTGGNAYGPFLPLAAGDTGVQNVASVTFSAASTAGSGALCLARPILTLPLTTAGVAAERDLLNQLPSLPRIIDGACLTWLYLAGAATAVNTPFYGAIEFAWG